ncbi:hypothetical protein Golax_024948 [Gossypium laxum]|uniref:Uncharacterized protein n=1 Tax=Gossypium laxum TaxID=34288 RepID=A0A7J8ZDL9_9ROSI|nr:hypothetical protein [Gossypium laxum]
MERKNHSVMMTIELNLLLSDWWHKSSHEQEVGISSNPYRWIGEPQGQIYQFINLPMQVQRKRTMRTPSPGTKPTGSGLPAPLL